VEVAAVAAVAIAVEVASAMVVEAAEATAAVEVEATAAVEAAEVHAAVEVPAVDTNLARKFKGPPATPDGPFACTPCMFGS
jgi:hypothetical protein